MQCIRNPRIRFQKGLQLRVAREIVVIVDKSSLAAEILCDISVSSAKLRNNALLACCEVQCLPRERRTLLYVTLHASYIPAIFCILLNTADELLIRFRHLRLHRGERTKPPEKNDR